MNILNKENKSMAPTAGRMEVAVSKREKFSWASNSPMGSFCMIPKDDLNIDGTYQREQISESKVLTIAREWDWKLFGALSVVMRPDGSLWVYDGGHRTRAAFRRDDIHELPCMVFECDTTEEEAKAFIGANTMKSEVSAFHKYRASLKAREPQALAIKAVLDKYGYRATDKSSAKYGFNAINTLKKLLKEDSDLADRTFEFCVQLADGGEPIKGSVLRAVFRCAKKLRDREDILKGGLREKLASFGMDGIEVAMRREKHITGRGGELVEARAVLDLINKGRKRKVLFPE